MVQKMAASNCPNNTVNNEKVLMIGNRLANVNQYPNGQHLNNTSHEHLESLLQHQVSLQSNSSQRNRLQSSNSLHVDSAVSIGSKQLQPVAVPAPATPAPAPAPAPVALRFV